MTLSDSEANPGPLESWWPQLPHSIVGGPIGKVQAPTASWCSAARWELVFEAQALSVTPQPWPGHPCPSEPKRQPDWQGVNPGLAKRLLDPPPGPSLQAAEWETNHSGPVRSVANGSGSSSASKGGGPSHLQGLSEPSTPGAADNAPPGL